MPRFALKDLMLGTTLIATGLACFAWAQQSPLGLLDYPLVLLLLVASGALVGAGILHPFKLDWLGALIGGLAMLAYVGSAIATAEI